MESDLTEEDTYDLLALGESLIDLISDEMVTSLGDAAAFQRYLGGQVTNLAANMALLDKPSALVSCVGQDGFGNYIIRRLQEYGVATNLVQSCRDATTSFSLIARHTRTPDFVIARGADSHIHPDEAIDAAAAHSRIVHTSAFGLSREPARTTIIDALSIGRQNGRLISLDPNYHPKIWPDVDDFIRVLEQVYELVNITKPSLDDCVRLFGSGYSIVDYAERFLQWGCDVVILTMGNAGIYLATASGDHYRIESNQVSVADITGAGDAYWAGYLSAYLDGLGPLEAACVGQVLAEIKITTVGPIFEPIDKEKLYQRSKDINYVKINPEKWRDISGGDSKRTR